MIKLKKIAVLFLTIILIFSACSKKEPAVENQINTPTECLSHIDSDDNGLCDSCLISVVEKLEIYSINDLHGKFADADFHPGVDEMTTFFKNAVNSEDNVILLSAGDMWQGSSESNLTEGAIMIDWMNELNFAGMTPGNHEFDWGEESVKNNSKLAQFPFLAINIYSRETKKLVEYCTPSTVVDVGNIQIGIIGAAGDNYSSISADKTKDFYFLTGNQLTALVKAEAKRLREAGADFIVYVLHDGTSGSLSGTVSGTKISSYYDISLSDGYVDLVFEGHTHQKYSFVDEHGVHHLQGGGNNNGISFAEININYANGNTKVISSRIIPSTEYEKEKDDPIVESLLKKYEKEISRADQIVGSNPTRLSRDAARQLVADLYYKAGIERWGDKYDIVLGGGFISITTPGYIPAGQITYGALQGLFPYDNALVLCTVKGTELKSKFFESSNANYFISYGSLGKEIKQNIDLNKTYYIITDTYSLQYAPNRLTEVEMYDYSTFARDLLAEYFGKPHVIGIADKTIGSNLNFAQALEKFYEDKNGEYFFNCIKGNYVVAKYSDGTEKPISEALKEGDITMKDVDAYGIRYIAYPKNLVER